MLTNFFLHVFLQLLESPFESESLSDKAIFTDYIYAIVIIRFISDLQTIGGRKGGVLGLKPHLIFKVFHSRAG